MRKIWKYIGVFLIINCAMGAFAVESSQHIMGVMNRLPTKMMEFCVDLTSQLKAVTRNNQEEMNEFNSCMDLQKKIDKLERNFNSQSLYDDFKMMDSGAFKKSVKSITRFADYENIFVFRNAKNKIIKNYANNVILYEDIILEDPILSKPEEFLPQLYKKDYETLVNYAIEYKNLCKRGANDLEEQEEDDLRGDFCTIFNKLFVENLYFEDIFQKFDKELNSDNINGAFIQLTLKFSLLRPLLGQHLGLPHYFEKIGEIRNLAKNTFKNRSNKSDKYISTKQENKLRQILDQLHFKFIDIATRIGFFKIFQKKIEAFLSNKNFAVWIKKNKNIRDFMCFYGRFFDEVFSILLTIQAKDHLMGIVQDNQDEEILNTFLKYKISMEEIKEELSYGGSYLEDYVSTLYNFDLFNKIMDRFLIFFCDTFRDYFIDNMLYPENDHKEISSVDMIRHQVRITDNSPLTAIEENLLQLSKSLNTKLKEFFQKKQPSQEDFFTTSLAVEKIKNQFFALITDLKIKHMDSTVTLEDLNSIALPAFLCAINNENAELFSKFTGQQYKFPQAIMEKETEDQQPEVENLQEEEKKAPVPAKKPRIFNKQDFSKQNLKKINAANRKKYKQKTETTVKTPSTTSEQQPEEKLPELNESQKKILKASKTFYDICENKSNIYNAYKIALNDTKNNIDNCVNLMGIPLVDGNNPLGSLIKTLQNSGKDTDHLENIKDKINDTKTYEDHGALVTLEDSYNVDQIKKLIKKENDKIEKFHTIIHLLSTANDYLNEFMTNWVQEESDENPTVVDFPTKNSLVVAPIPSQPFYHWGHIPKIQGEPGQEGPTARKKKQKKKQEEVKMVFKDGDDQEKERKEAEEALEAAREEQRKIGAQILKEELARQAQEKLIKQEREATEAMEKIIAQIQFKKSLWKKK